MNRLTRKTDGKDYYMHCRVIEKTNEVLGHNEKPLKPDKYYKKEPYQVVDYAKEEEMIIKLGKLEDLMDKYNVDSLEELEERLQRPSIYTFKDEEECKKLKKGGKK